MIDTVICETTTRVQCHHTNLSSASFGLQCWEAWCILSGSTLDSGNLVSHSATVSRMFESSSRGHAVINNHIFTFGTQQDVGWVGGSMFISSVTQLPQWAAPETRKTFFFPPWLHQQHFFYFFSPWHKKCTMLLFNPFTEGTVTLMLFVLYQKCLMQRSDVLPRRTQMPIEAELWARYVVF